jgi:hypothetical protein
MEDHIREALLWALTRSLILDSIIKELEEKRNM